MTKDATPLVLRTARRPLLALALTAGATAACEDTTGLGQLSASIEVSPADITFPTVPVGVRSTEPLTVRSIGSAQLALETPRFEGDDVFRLEGELPEILTPGQSAALQVVALASEVGTYTGTLIIVSDARDNPEVRIPLQYQAVTAPDCDDGNDCTEDIFNSELNACENNFADGRTCQPADRCIVDAVCQQGVCLGRQKSCDDQSICTLDVCRQIDGECLFIPNETVCDDKNPCTADLCTNEGCAHEPLANGIACDDGDLCTLQDTCFGGACIGRGQPDGTACNDNDSCTVGDTCRAGVCQGESLIANTAEGEVIFSYPLTEWEERAFLHRRHVSMSDEGTFYGLDHLNLPDEQGLTHIVFAFNQCGTQVYDFSYRPPDPFVSVIAVRRSLQVGEESVRMVVGVRQLPDNGFEPQTTTYLLDDEGNPELSAVRVTGGESGRSLLPDGSQIWGTVVPLNFGPFENISDAQQNLVVVRGDRDGNALWRHERSSDFWSEFLGVAGPRVLFWSEGRFGALDFNTGALVWSQPTQFITQEIALSTQLNLGVARASSQILAVEILNGTQVFTYPTAVDGTYVPRTDPIISADGRILFMMERRDISPDDGSATPTDLYWVELDTTGRLLNETRLPYEFAGEFRDTRAEDFSDDPYPTVADDGITYVGYGDHFWAIERGGEIRWTLTSTNPAAFTATVPLLREDGVLLMSRGSREIIGVRTNGGQMSEAGWASYRHDNDRTNFTP